jgi:NAD(P)-dependent dehydrogenase (short-subunit alcohol dehydrogenase family)
MSYFRILLTFVVVVLIASGAGLPAAAAEHADTEARAVLITGASTGIGRRIAETLAENGYFVYAGARKQKDLDALDAIDNVKALQLDVTIQADIDAAVAAVRDGGRGLYGLVNNAGVAIGGPLIEVDEDELQWLFDVNVFGPYRITQAFAPLIIESQGRITTIGSISGILSGKFTGHYSMSKHAIEAYTDSLATEMERFGVAVSVIEPGNYRSEITASAVSRMTSQDYATDESRYADEFGSWSEQMPDRDMYKEPDEVAEAALHALFSDEPKRRYMVVPNEKEADWTIRQMLRETVQLNEWQAYSYSRAELIAMLDEALGVGREASP